ncbi:MAG: hypothetical protein Fur006_40070 [Coleofasciculaceae cyanobacterium]
MSQSGTVFYLKVQRIEKFCLFELSWGRGQQLNVTLPYPETLDTLYQEWRTDYLGFYKTALRGRIVDNGTNASSPALRGRVVDDGTIAPPPIDWHAKLVQAEAKLLYEFHNWLRQGELFELRSCLAKAVREIEIEKVGEGEAEKGKTSPYVEVFLTCNPLDLARLPWEAWEIGTEFAATGKIRFVRTPPNIHHEVPITSRNHRGKARILAILGDDTGLNFEADEEAVKSLSSLANIEFLGWQPNQDIGELKAKIVEKIADEQGWDILLFAGHSNEKDLVGGELAIAPGASLFLQEIEQSLLLAKARGLQFALFNSCNGLSIANALISLGLSQVAVMREPIHNSVAQEFLVRFLQSLGEYKDVHESLLAASQHLKLEKHLTYPSAYLIPSLFRHPDASLFRLQPCDRWRWLKRWRPKKREAIALLTLALASWQIPIQGSLIEQRVLMQARYRQLTHQVPTTNKPPVLLVQIDADSIRKAKIPYPAVPMDRSYLAQLVDKLATLNTKVVGIDYLLDRPQIKKENDQKLAQSLRTSAQKGTWFVFATARSDGGGWFEVLPELAQPTWSLQGDVLVLGNELRYMTLVPRQDSSPQNLPFSYLLALAHQLNFKQSQHPPQPQLQSSSDWLFQLKAYIQQTTGKEHKNFFSPSARLQPITNSAYQFGQMWLHPIIDFSIPPNQVYQRLPAWQLLEKSPDSLKLDPNRPQIVMIAAGGYGEAGASKPGEDNFPVPPALGFWRSQPDSFDSRLVFPGGEAHAYMIHHFLNQRLVVPIPDLWLIGLAAVLGKAAALALEQEKRERNQEKGKTMAWLLPSGQGKWMLWMASATAIYGLASLQLYISSAVLLPVLLPTATFWSYILLAHVERKSHG